MLSVWSFWRSPEGSLTGKGEKMAEALLEMVFWLPWAGLIGCFIFEAIRDGRRENKDAEN